MKYKTDYNRYTFKKDDDWGDYDKGVYRKPVFNKKGYSIKHYRDNEGKRFTTAEHLVKWVYFNGEIPEGYEIDHIVPISDGGTNKLSNLRIVTHSENMLNEKTRAKLSNAKKSNQWNTGKTHTLEHRRKIGESNKGKKHPIKSIIESANKHKKPVIQYSRENIFIKEWESAVDAAKELGISQEGIGRVCKNKLKTSGNYIWRFKNEKV